MEKKPSNSTVRTKNSLLKDNNRTNQRAGYKDIMGVLLREIREKRLDVGDYIPTEHELVERFNVSRNTVRQALMEIEKFGFIKRSRGTKSVLISTDPNSDFVNSVKSIGELLQYGRKTEATLLSVERIVANATLAERLDTKEGSEWLRIEVQRKKPNGSFPVGYSEIYVDSRYSEIADMINEHAVIYTLLEEKFGILFKSVKQTIQASAANANIASRLMVPINSPILNVKTKFIESNGSVAEIGFGYFPAGRYAFEMLLERGPGQRVDD